MDLTGGAVRLDPASPAEAAAALADASRTGLTVTPVGGGTKSRRGWPAEPGAVLHTAGLARVVDYAPGDMTLTVEGGAQVADVVALVAGHGQCWPQAEARPGATVGGVLAAAAGGRARLRFGPVRDSLLEVVVATGDGRVVRGGGRTVKGVAGFDLPRLLTGSLGTLGVIVQATLKLWPIPPARGWFAAQGRTPDVLALGARVLAEVYRPAAVVAAPGGLWVELVGPPDDVAPPPGMAPAQAPPHLSGRGMVEAGVPPARLPELVSALDAGRRRYEAWLGVGLCRVAVDEPGDVDAVRALATGLGGHAQVLDGPDDLRHDPFGPPPPGITIMRRMKAAFDPAGILAPGRFVGGPA